MKSSNLATCVIAVTGMNNALGFISSHPATPYVSSSSSSSDSITFPLYSSESSEIPVGEGVSSGSDVKVSEEMVVELPKMSRSIPFMERPSALKGVLAGDVGFDPLGFARSEEELMNYREAEMKHARLAMLAAAGWPISELFDKKIASILGLPALVDSNDRVPSLLNGGLGKVSPVYWVGCILFAAGIDVLGTFRARSDSLDYFPGNFGFDPLGLYPKDEEGQRRMQLAEIKNGRLAMMAVFGFAIQEAVTNLGVIDETPLFFFPIMKSLHMYTNSGYIQ